MNYPSQGPAYPGAGAPPQQPPSWNGYPQQQGTPQQPFNGYGAQQQPNYSRQPPGPPGYGFTPAPPPKKRRTALWISAVVGVLVVAGAAVGIVVATSHSGSTGKSDEDQIRAAISSFADTLTTQGMEAATEASCSDIRQQWDQMPDEKKSALRQAKYNATVVKITDIKVTGDTATANVDMTATATLNGVTKKVPSSGEANKLKKENGTWKMCS
jgi:hypothetical protein